MSEALYASHTKSLDGHSKVSEIEKQEREILEKYVAPLMYIVCESQEKPWTSNCNSEFTAV